jgi:hypothetical protein
LGKTCFDISAAKNQGKGEVFHTGKGWCEGFDGERREEV